MSINHDDLENWAARCAEELQDFCNEAQQAAGDPDGEDCLPGTRALLRELDCILAGQPTWQAQLTTMADKYPGEIKLDEDPQ